jgi:L-asparagine transporter-like permease
MLPAMEWLSLVSLLLVLVLVARGTPGRRMLVIVAVTLAVVVVILFAERSGLWPEAMRQ